MCWSIAVVHAGPNEAAPGHLTSRSLVWYRNLVMKDYVSTADDTTWFKYDLVANIVHEGLPEAGKGTYNAQVLHKVRSLPYRGLPRE